MQLDWEKLLQQITELTAQWGLKVLGGLVVLIIGYVIAGWVARRIRAIQAGPLDPTLMPTIAKVVRLLVLALTLVAVLSTWGIPIASLLAVLGAAGLAIGLALQGTLSNVAAGLILLTMRPFEVGDTIDVGSSARLTVDEIGLIMTKLRTPDNIFVAMPNSLLWGREIQNLTRNPTRRVDMVAGIAYDDDIDKALRIIHEVLAEDARILTEPAPMVAVGSLGDSSVNILVRPWVNTPDYYNVNRDFQKAIKQRFDAEDISIPFPQRDVHLHQVS